MFKLWALEDFPLILINVFCRECCSEKNIIKIQLSYLCRNIIILYKNEKGQQCLDSSDQMSSLLCAPLNCDGLSYYLVTGTCSVWPCGQLVAAA